MKYSKTATFLLILASMIKMFFRGRANRPPELPPRRIVAMQLTTNIGDMIFATSVFRAIKEKYPSSELAIVGSKKNAITLSGNSDVDRYIAIPGSARELIRALRSVRADYGFSLNTSTLDIASMFLAGIKTIACFDLANAPHAHTRSYKLLKRLCIQVPFYIGRYVSQEYLRILEPISIFSKNTGKYLYIDKTVIEPTRSKFLERGVDITKEKVIAISPGAGTKIKQWPEERFAEIADYLNMEHGYRIAVIGGPGDKAEIERFKSKLKIRDLIDASDLSLQELVYFISTCKLLIANDSGPVYIAEAFKVPTLVVVGPTDEFEHPPHGPLNAVVTPSRDEEAPEMRGHLVGFSKEKAREQIERVTVEEVRKVLDELIKKI